MNVDVLPTRIPSVATLRAIAFNDRTAAVAAAIGEILKRIEVEGRGPTSWESDNLLEAILCLQGGNPFLAAANLETAIAMPRCGENHFTVPRHELQTVRDLEQKLQSLRVSTT